MLTMNEIEVKKKSEKYKNVTSLMDRKEFKQAVVGVVRTVA